VDRAVRLRADEYRWSRSSIEIKKIVDATAWSGIDTLRHQIERWRGRPGSRDVGGHRGTGSTEGSGSPGRRLRRDVEQLAV
jgi:hypothetical protein